MEKAAKGKQKGQVHRLPLAVKCNEIRKNRDGLSTTTRSEPENVSRTIGSGQDGQYFDWPIRVKVSKRNWNGYQIVSDVQLEVENPHPVRMDSECLAEFSAALAALFAADECTVLVTEQTKHKKGKPLAVPDQRTTPPKNDSGESR